MTDGLKISIERLYLVFSKYSASNMTGSPLYDDLNNWNDELLSKPLRILSDDDLSRFVGSVILTWGDENDFRHFLPRIFELMAELTTPYDIWIVYSRLEDAKWKDWPQEEQSAINEFTLSLWDSLLQDNSEKAELEFNDYFHAIAYYYPDFSVLLKVWQEKTTFPSIKHLTNYIFNERQNIFDNNFIDSREKNTKNVKEFKDWLSSENIIKKIEQAFYNYEKEEISERISWVEKILNDERKYST